MNDLYGNIDEKKRKLTKKPSSEKNLGDWFKRKGAPGKKGGWVDCNTCRDGKCKSCGRSDGEKRSKKPRCRPTPSACKGFKNEELSMDLEQIIREELKAVLDEEKKEKTKKDACYNKVKSRYKVWPSAYASGALVKCRKVGAKNWGNSKKESQATRSSAVSAQNFSKAVIRRLRSGEITTKQAEKAYKDRGLDVPKNLKFTNENLPLDLDQIIREELSAVLDELRCWDGHQRAKGTKKGAAGSYEKIKEEASDLKSKVIKALRDEGGAAGMDALKKHTKASKEEINKIINSSSNIEVHEDGDIILMDSLEEKKKKKACKPSKGKRFAKRVDGKCRSFGQKGQAKGGGDRIRPGTKKGDAYCARSAKIKKCKNPPCANALSRKKWKCRGSKSVAE